MTVSIPNIQLKNISILNMPTRAFLLDGLSPALDSSLYISHDPPMGL